MFLLPDFGQMLANSADVGSNGFLESGPEVDVGEDAGELRVGLLEVLLYDIEVLLGEVGVY